MLWFNGWKRIFVNDETRQCLQLQNSVTDIAKAVEILSSGGLVAVPSETVYGLGADATNSSAVQKIFTAKQRPVGHPLIVHVANIESARSFSSDFNEVAETLGSAFWPGPLTLLVKRSIKVIDEITGGRETVALRVPAHETFQKVLAAFSRISSGAIAAPSANLYGSVSPTTAQHVLSDMGYLIDAVIDGGQCAVGIESTIVDCTVNPPTILRQGAITLELVNEALTPTGVIATEEINGDSRAPGMKLSHYAPRANVKLFETKDSLFAYANQCDVNKVPYVSITGHEDQKLYARDLYSLLRDADALQPHEILVLLPESTDIGIAIRDRLFKAAAPH
jgi:L-threonylcarbamoyladenylate synthase